MAVPMSLMISDASGRKEINTLSQTRSNSNIKAKGGSKDIVEDGENSTGSVKAAKVGLL